MESIIEYLINFRSVVTEHALFSIGMLLVVGYLFGIIAKKFKLPEITGFILAGLLLGDTLLGVVHHEMNEGLVIVTDVALGLIALTIGGEFYLAKLKKMGKEVVIMTTTQIVLTFVTVAVSLFLFRMELPYALLMGAIATATAPAATVAIVQSLRAHGPFIDRLYGLVALDDAGCVIIFGIIFAIASSMIGPAEAMAHTSSFHMILEAFGEIAFSLILGIVFGVLIHVTTKKKNRNGEILILTLAFIFLETALAIVFHLSPLLSNMAAGAVLINLSPRNHRIFRAIEPLTPPIYALFFAIAGTHLDPTVLFQKEILLLGTVFILARAFGKYFGVRFGGLLCKADKKTRANLGYCMLPQAGVSIGLIMMIKASPMVAELPPEQSAIIILMVNIILLSVFFNEMIGPPLSRYAIMRAMDIKEK